MVMKIVLLIALAVALRNGYAQNCGSATRSEKMFWYKQRSLTGCDKPKDTLVQLQVPEGFDYVKPSVVKIAQCSGLFCPNYPTKCLPVEPQTKVLVVEAFKRGADHDPSCVTVTVQEHKECSCDCVHSDCQQENEVFNESICECECDEDRKNICEEKEANGEDVQWSEKACDCLCRRPKHCDDTMDWNQGLCSCEYKEIFINSLNNELYYKQSDI